MVGAAAPLLTGCILKQVIILHKNALFMRKILTVFLGKYCASSSDPTFCPFTPYFTILDPLLTYS